MRVPMRVSMSMISTTVVMPAAVATMWLEDTVYGVEHIVTADAAPAAVTKCYKIHNITNKTDDGRDNHGARLYLKAFMVKNVMHSESCFDYEPDDEAPDENNTHKCAKHLSTEESVRFLFGWRLHG